MAINKEEIKKKIIYRASYRGTKEMDKLLSSFVIKYLNSLNKNELVLLEKFLETEDEDLYKYYNGLQTKNIIDDNKISKLFKKFEYKNLSKVLRILKENQVEISNQILENNCLLEISVRKSNSLKIFELFQNFYGVEIREL